MAYLITQLLVPLLATAAFAALAGWCYYAMRARSKDEAQERERARLLNELLGVTSPTRRLGEAPLELETQRRRADLESARVAELERALASARARADDAAEQKMQLESELARLREASAIPAPVALAAPTAPTAPAADETETLRQAWRLRYFEQRVRYLETEREAAAELPAAALASESAEATAEAPTDVAEEPRPAVDLAALWRARYYESRTRFLERAAREAARADDSPAPPPIAEAAQPLLDVGRTADEEKMLQWRLRYLTQRVSHLQDAALAAQPPLAADAAKLPPPASPAPTHAPAARPARSSLFMAKSPFVSDDDCALKRTEARVSSRRVCGCGQIGMLAQWPKLGGEGSKSRSE